MTQAVASQPPGAWAWVVGALAGAILVNVIIFAGAPLLLRLGQSQPAAPLPVQQMVFLSPPPEIYKEPPPQDKPPPPPKPAAPSAAPLDASIIKPHLEAPGLEPAPSDFATVPMAIPAPAGPVSSGELGKPDQMPMPLAQPRPPYPYLARRQGVQGWVRVRILVDSQGAVSKVILLQSHPQGVFDKTVRRTLKSWRFQPATRDRHPVSTWVQTTIRFNLER